MTNFHYFFDKNTYFFDKITYFMTILHNFFTISHTTIPHYNFTKRHEKFPKIPEFFLRNKISFLWSSCGFLLQPTNTKLLYLKPSTPNLCECHNCDLRPHSCPNVTAASKLWFLSALIKMNQKKMVTSATWDSNLMCMS